MDIFFSIIFDTKNKIEVMTYYRMVKLHNENCYEYVKDASWLLHEAFCLYSQKDIYKPYEKHHSTALDAGKLAKSLNKAIIIL
mgnify:CR=1 FL=1